MGLKLAHTMGIRTGFITGRKSPAVSQRAQELEVEFVYLGQATKMAAFDECLQKADVQADEVAYMGDDLPDMPVAKRAGLAVAVANAAPELKAISHYVTTRGGGDGSATGSSGTYPEGPGKMGRGNSPGTRLILFGCQTYSGNKSSKSQKCCALGTFLTPHKATFAFWHRG